jgi:hypothetical protein
VVIIIICVENTKKKSNLITEFPRRFIFLLLLFFFLFLLLLLLLLLFSSYFLLGRNLIREIPDWNIDAVINNARDVWNEGFYFIIIYINYLIFQLALGRIDVLSPPPPSFSSLINNNKKTLGSDFLDNDDSAKIVFYTSLYRTYERLLVLFL